MLSVCVLATWVTVAASVSHVLPVDSTYASGSHLLLVGHTVRHRSRSWSGRSGLRA